MLRFSVVNKDYHYTTSRVVVRCRSIYGRQLGR